MSFRRLVADPMQIIRASAICIAGLSAALVFSRCKKEDRSEIRDRTAGLAGTRTWKRSSEKLVWGVFSAEGRSDTAFAIALLEAERLRVLDLSLSYRYSTDSFLIYENEKDQNTGISGTLSYNYRNDSIYLLRTFTNKANYTKDLFRCRR